MIGVHSGPVETEAGRAVAGVAARALRAAVETLSGPAFGGRAVGSPGQERARRWLSARLRETGLQVHEVAFPLTVWGAAAPAEARWLPPGAPPQPLRRWGDFAVHPRSAPAPTPLRGPVVPWDGRVPVRGAWVLLARGGPAPAEVLPKLRSAAALGLLVPQAADAGGLVKVLPSSAPWPLPVLRVRAEVAERLPGNELEAVIPEATAVEAIGVNLLADLPGGGGHRILVGAHYDGVGDDPDGTRFPGAADNASGVAVVLEVARVLARTRPPGGLDVTFALFDAEELGARGSAHLARTLAAGSAEAAQLSGVIVIDHVARWRGAVWVEMGPGSDALRAALDRAGRKLGIPLREGPVASDNRPLAAAGIPAAGLATGGERAHRMNDVPDAVDTGPMVQVARLVLGALWYLAAALQGM